MARPVFASEEGAVANAARAAVALDLTGDYVLRGFGTGILREGTGTTLETTLYRGTSYTIIAGGCEDALDVDVRVYDQNWNLVDEDNDTDAIAVVTFVPRWTGTFYIKVIMHSCVYGERYAHYSLQLAYER